MTLGAEVCSVTLYDVTHPLGCETLYQNYAQKVSEDKKKEWVFSVDQKKKKEKEKVFAKKGVGFWFPKVIEDQKQVLSKNPLGFRS